MLLKLNRTSVEQAFVQFLELFKDYRAVKYWMCW